jgi:hypothetical protein
MLNAPGHVHGFHINVVGEVDSAENKETDDFMHYHLGGGFVDEHTHELFQAGPAVTLEGSSTLRFGIDLATNATGFRNEHDVKLKVVLVPEQTKTHPAGDMMGTDDLYAEIELKEFKWEVISADHSGKTSAPAITTSLFMGPFSLKTFSAPSIDIDYVDGKDDDKDGKFDRNDPTKDKDPEAGFPDFTPDVSTTYKGSGGLELGYEIAPVTLTLGILSAQDWANDDPESYKIEERIGINCLVDKDGRGGSKFDDDGIFSYSDCKVTKIKKDEVDDRNDENAYAFLGKANVDIGESANVEFAVAYAHMYKDIPAGELTNIKQSADKLDDKTQSQDDIGLGAMASFDLLDSDGDGDNDLTATIAFDGRIPSDESSIPWDVGGGVNWTISADDESKIETALMMHVPEAGESDISVRVALTEADGDKGALEGLGAKLAVRLDGVTGDESTWTTMIAGSYDVEGIKPFFSVSFSSAEDAKTSFRAGLELAVIDHLTTTLLYRSTDITGGSKGDLTAALKVSY